MSSKADKVNEILNELSKVIVGKRNIMELVLSGILANGNILFHDKPGNAKTTMAKAMAQVMGVGFKRISFTPDLLPNDILGVSVFNMKENEFQFKPGPIFTNILLADEINRASPKTQSALLEAMQEQTVSVDGVTYTLDAPFLVMATENPLEYEGTFPLPEAQLDRFLMKTEVGYPDTIQDEKEILLRRINRKQESFQLEQIITKEELLGLQREVENVEISEPILEYITRLITATRESKKIAVGASPRGSLGLVLASRAYAFVKGRNYVNPQDIQDMFVPVVGHRIILRSGDMLSGVSSAQILMEILQSIPAPRLE